MKSKLGYLNGENYEASKGSLSINSIPLTHVGKIKGRETFIMGTLFVKEGLVLAPLNHQELKLYNKQNNVVAKVMTEAGGEFKVVGVIPNGSYRLVLESSKYKGSLGVEIKSYEVKGLKLIAQRKL